MDERAAGAADRRLGLRVRTRRLEIGMSQERLAALLGVTFQQVQKYEKGVNRIAASRLLDIAHALGVSAASLLEDLDARARSGEDLDAGVRGEDSITTSLATPEGAAMAALFARVTDPQVRRRLLGLARAITEEAPA